MSFIKKALFLVIFIYTFHTEAQVVRRAAFDFGSGKVKLQVADIDTQTHKIIQSVYSDDIMILLSEDLAHNPDGRFSTKIQEEALRATGLLKQKAVEYGAIEFSGLATEAYRKAANGGQLVRRYLSELGIHVKIISQIEEGESGFWALIAETNMDPNQVISWDIGGGSFQISYLNEQKETQVYMAPFGRSTTKNAMIEFVKGQNPLEVISPNPINAQEWQASIDFLISALPQAPDELLLKLKRNDVKMIGIAAHPEQLRELKTYSLRDVEVVLAERIGKDDQEMQKIHKSPINAISELVIVSGIMQKLDVDQVTYFRTTSGSTSALLVMEEYW